ncbi:hypothetical protein IG631_16733 [Alternaria alternata]|nr:hypothetical protein IG631_16733 [Alternaria alternata]
MFFPRRPTLSFLSHQPPPTITPAPRFIGWEALQSDAPKRCGHCLLRHMSSAGPATTGWARRYAWVLTG